MASEVGNHGDDAVGLARAKARAAYDHARARREKAKADLLEGKTIYLDDALAQIAALASAVRRQLDLAPAYLSADLTPEVREAATAAMREAVDRALADLTTRTKHATNH